MQNEIKTRWGDSKNEIGFDVHHVYEQNEIKTRPLMMEKCKTWETRLKRGGGDSVNLPRWGHRTNKSRHSSISCQTTFRNLTAVGTASFQGACFSKIITEEWNVFGQSDAAKLCPGFSFGLEWYPMIFNGIYTYRVIWWRAPESGGLHHSESDMPCGSPSLPSCTLFPHLILSRLNLLMRR